MVELISRSGIALVAMMGSPSLPDGVQPLEVVAVDVSGFPRVVVDVALPAEELPGDVTADAFEMPGATGVVAEPLLAADLTVGLVLDDGSGIPVETIEAQQGAVTELVRNVPPDVELLTATTSGAIVGPTTDRAATLAAVGSLGSTPPASTVAGAAIRAAAVLETAPDPRHQLVLISAAAVELDPEDAELLMTSLDRSGSALRVLSIGGAAGARLASVAAATGGFAVDIGSGPAAALRAVDALTTTFTDQYRVTATVAEPGDQLVRLTVSGRRYEALVPDLGASIAPPTTAATTMTSSTTTTTTAVPSQGPPPAARGASGSERRDRGSTVLAGAQAVVAVAAIGAVIAAWRRRRISARSGRRT